MKMIDNIIIVVVMVLLLAGCKKYPENKWPILILPPEKKLEKIVGAKMVEYKINGVSQMNKTHSSYEYVVIADYDLYIRQEEYSRDNYPHLQVDSVKWNGERISSHILVRFSKDKKYLWKWKILKLTNTEFKYQYNENNQLYEIHFRK